MIIILFVIEIIIKADVANVFMAIFAPEDSNDNSH
jgi:hypothetical protein